MNLIKKSFTTLTVVATIVWSMGLAAFVPTAQAQIQSGDLIKASQTTVYYYGADGKRYVFPNEKTYFTWYSDFSHVVTITDAELAAIPFGANNVTYRPGVKLVKITTDPKVYAVEKNGTLRWITTAAIAASLYGSDWASLVEDVPDGFFVNYTIGANITDASQHDPAAARAASPTINADKGLIAGTPTTGGQLSLSLASDSPVSQSVPGGATPASNVPFTKINLTATGGSVLVNRLTVTRAGLSTNDHVDAVKIWMGSTQLDTAQTLNSNNQVTFRINQTIAANAVITLTIAADLDSTSGQASAEIRFGVASNADVDTNAVSVTGAPVWGNTMTAADVSVGSLLIDQGASMPVQNSDVDLDNTATFFGVRLTAGSAEAVSITNITFENGDQATINSNDVQDITLINENTGATLATVASLNANGNAVFDLSANPLTMAKGETRNLRLEATVINGAGRYVAFDINDGVSFLIQATGQQYGFGVSLQNGGTWTQQTAPCAPTTSTCSGTGVGNRVLVNQGTVTVSKATSSPAAGNIAIGGSNINVAEFSYEIRGESIRFGTTVVELNVTSPANAGSTCATVIDNVRLVDATTGAALAGPVTPAIAGGGTLTAGPDVCVATFSSSYELPVGTQTVRVTLNTTSSINSGDTVLAELKGGSFANVRGLTSNRTITPTPAFDVPANTQTVRGPILSAQMGATPVAGNVVAGKTRFNVAYIGLDASAGGEDVRVSSLKVSMDVAATATNTDWLNARLINVATGVQVGQTLQPSANAATFTFSGDELVVAQTQQVNLALQIDIPSTATPGVTFSFDVAVNTDITATGKSSSTAAAVTVSGDSPTQTVVASGRLQVTLDANNPVGAQLVASSNGNNAVTYRFEAFDEAVDVTELYIVGVDPASANYDGGAADIAAATTTFGKNVASIEVFVDGVKVGSSLAGTSNGVHLLSVASGTIVIPKDSNKTVSIRVNMHEKANVASGETFRVGIADASVATATGLGAGANWQSNTGAITDAYLVTATGQDSGTVIANINSTGAVGGLIDGGNIMSAHDGILTVTLNASSLAGDQTGATNSPLLTLNFTATNDQVTVSELEFLVSGTCGFVAQAYRVRDQNNTKQYASGVLAAGAASMSTDIAVTDSTLAISAGQTQVAVIEVDTSACLATTTAQVRVQQADVLNSVRGVIYNAIDGINIGASAAAASTPNWANVDGAANAGPRTKELPLTGNSVRF